MKTPHQSLEQLYEDAMYYHLIKQGWSPQKAHHWVKQMIQKTS